MRSAVHVGGSIYAMRGTGRVGTWCCAVGSAAMAAACRFPELPDIPADASIDAVIDTADPDAPGVDASTDAAEIDGAAIDALPVDAPPIDATPIDAPWVLNGSYALASTPSLFCASGAVNFSFNSVTFSTVTSTLRARAGSGTQPCLMTGPVPTGTTFSLTCSIAGNCTETYSLMGTITGPNTFMGTFTAMFSGTGCFDCTSQTFPVMGTM
jgi:hypothetical protein